MTGYTVCFGDGQVRDRYMTCRWVTHVLEYEATVGDLTSVPAVAARVVGTVVQ